jgi:UDP-MurNAc hydroxylase
MREPGVFPHQGQALTWLQERIPEQSALCLLPGDAIELGSEAVTRSPEWADFSLDDCDDYLDRYARQRSDDISATYARYPDPPSGSALYERFEDHFMRLGGMSNYFLERIGMTVRFEVAGDAGGTWDVRLGPDGVGVDRAKGRLASYGFAVEARWLDAVLTGEIRWEDLFLSLRFSAWREPDLYNDYLVGLLKHADPSALAAIEEYETGRDPDDMVVLRDRTRDRDVAVSRYCPHAGEDLSESAVLSDGVLRCLGHNFEFDLESGECLNARCSPLKVRPLAPSRT